MSAQFARLRRELERHQLRRAQELPTVSVVPEGGLALRRAFFAAGAELFGGWLVSSQQGVGALLRDLLRAVCERHDVSRLALQELAAARGGSLQDATSAWAVREPAERELWLRHAGAGVTLASAQAAMRWLELMTTTERESLLTRAQRVVRTLEPLRALRTLSQFLPAACWSGLCVERPTREALRSLAAIAHEAPRLPIAAIGPESELIGASTGCDLRTQQLLREGWIAPSAAVRELEPAAGDRRAESEAMRASLGPGARVAEPSGFAHTQQAARSLLDAAREAHAADASDAQETAERARSLAERLLFEALNLHPATTGLFELNGRMAFDFGGRPAEVDLVARSRRLAIEVDGYFHFTGEAAYRRDRRKDVVLQTQGFWVLRCLASDVVEQLDTVVRSVCELVEQRQAAPAPEEV